jgi:hypothetical protein
VYRFTINGKGKVLAIRLAGLVLAKPLVKFVPSQVLIVIIE